MHEPARRRRARAHGCAPRRPRVPSLAPRPRPHSSLLAPTASLAAPVRAHAGALAARGVCAPPSGGRPRGRPVGCAFAHSVRQAPHSAPSVSPAPWFAGLRGAIPRLHLQMHSIGVQPWEAHPCASQRVPCTSTQPPARQSLASSGPRAHRVPSSVQCEAALFDCSPASQLCTFGTPPGWRRGNWRAGLQAPRFAAHAAAAKPYGSCSWVFACMGECTPLRAAKGIWAAHSRTAAEQHAPGICSAGARPNIDASKACGARLQAPRDPCRSRCALGCLLAGAVRSDARRPLLLSSPLPGASAAVRKVTARFFEHLLAGGEPPLCSNTHGSGSGRGSATSGHQARHVLSERLAQQYACDTLAQGMMHSGTAWKRAVRRPASCCGRLHTAVAAAQPPKPRRGGQSGRDAGSGVLYCICPRWSLVAQALTWTGTQ